MRAIPICQVAAAAAVAQTKGDYDCHWVISQAGAFEMRHRFDLTRDGAGWLRLRGTRTVFAPAAPPDLMPTRSKGRWDPVTEAGAPAIWIAGNVWDTAPRPVAVAERLTFGPMRTLRMTALDPSGDAVIHTKVLCVPAGR